MKRYLSSAPTLVAPRPQEPLLLYAVAMNQVASATLVAQRELDDEEAAMANPSSDKPESSPARSGADKPKVAQASEVDQQEMPKKKVV